MWCPCPYTQCDDLNSTSFISNEMGSFPVLHGFLSLSSGNMGGGVYPGSVVGLQRSATCGYLPSHHFYPIKDDFNDQPALVNGRLTITDGKLDDDDDVVKGKVTVQNGRNGEASQHDDGGKKSRDYSDDSLTPDSTLPAVIRRRNRNRRKKLATSMVEPTQSGVGWEGEGTKPPPRNRSHSVSDDQWAQLMADQTTTSTNVTVPTSPGPACPPGHTPADMSAFAGMTPRRTYNTMTSGGRSGALGRGMVSSASVCDLNSLAQQQQPPPQCFNNTHAANSFQQLNMMGYPGGMVWGAPVPCELCQGSPMFPGNPSVPGMKRTASNLSMNLSSVGSDVTGYPWAPPPPHIHHHMPPMYPGYYPGYHSHMALPPMGAPMGLNMSIPDSMHTFSKVPSSPAPSVRSTSHRSHKSSKSRSFNTADTSGRRSRNRKAKRSEESEESRSSSVSEDMDDVDDRASKSGHGSLAWQCDHCTFINNGGTRTCGMCSKTLPGGGSSSGRTSRRGSERRRSDRRRDRRTDHEDDDRDVSEYENDDGGVVKSNLSFNIKESKSDTRTKVSSKSKNKKKSRRRGSSASNSDSESEEEEEERLERRMKDLRVSSSSRRRGSDYEGVSNKEKDREREKNSRKKEGKLRWKE